MVRSYEVWIDATNEHHVARHRVSVREIIQVFSNDPVIRRNRRATTSQSGH